MNEVIDQMIDAFLPAYNPSQIEGDLNEGMRAALRAALEAAGKPYEEQTPHIAKLKAWDDLCRAAYGETDDNV